MNLPDGGRDKDGIEYREESQVNSQKFEPEKTAGDKVADASGEETDSKSMIYPDGSTYKGSFKDGKRHGHGVWTSNSGTYDGQWMDDHQHGHGEQTWADGRCFTGTLVMGKFEGKGRMKWNTPQGTLIYEGQYVNDAKHGQGKFMWPDGRMYDGEWVQGKRWGAATYTNSQGGKRKGIWKDDKLERWVDSTDDAAAGGP